MTKTRTRTDVHATITDAIVAAIEAGTDAWQMPWHRAGGALSRPVNIASGNPYRGINILALWVAAQTRDFTRPEWGTYRQWAAKGAQVRKGEKGTTTVFYRELAVEAEDTADDGDTASPERRCVARANIVFNADQVDGWKPAPTEAPSVGEEFTTVVNAEAFVAATAADIRQGGDAAFYRPATDHIQMPPKEAFHGSPTSTPAEAYYSTLCHELVHWSGATHRLDRTLKTRFGSEAYAAEELIAELGAAFLCADLEISLEPRPDHAAYVATWLKVLKNDTRAIFTAASKAQQAVQFLHGLGEDAAEPSKTDAVADEVAA
ncbi:ArdC family protein [Amorphus sp. MBR-141]